MPTRHITSALAICALLLGVTAAPLTPPAFAKSGKAKVEEKTTEAKEAKDVKEPDGPKVARERMGEWELECFDPKINGLNCQIVQKLVATDTNKLVLVVSIAFDPASKKHLMQVALPLNFMLKPGVEIAIGDQRTVAQVDRCSAEGCFIEGIAGDDLVGAMSKGAKADVKFLASAEKRLVIPFSLSGFSAAYEKMKSRNAA
ncbi:MAG: invasion associated locus B family protein [Hyphomicrobiaceae bacterium]|nr:invasion associated locus B family protein [Hyphomicrobiaceae bacterium]